MNNRGYQFLSGNLIKLLACIFMTFDHIGFILYPDVEWLRIIGRLAMPLFAFMIAEGAYYSKNRLKYFLTMFSMGVLIELVFYIFTKEVYMNIMLTFSCSLIIIFLFDWLIKDLLLKHNIKAIILKGLLLVFTILGICVLFYFVVFDYSYTGLFIPVAVYLFRSKYYPDKLKVLDQIIFKLLAIALLIIIRAFTYSIIDLYGLFSLTILLFYNNKRGKWKLKYFFYFYYPIHVGLLYLLYMLLNGIPLF